MPHADLLVIGAGPAGCAAAITARLAGLSVTLIEQSAFPRPRPGETLHPGVEPLLRQLGVWQRVEAAGFLRHLGHWVRWDGPRTFVPFGSDPSGPWRGLQAWRPIFDGILLDRARELGATILQPCRALAPLVAKDARVIGIQTSAGPLHANVTIDASGSGQLFARLLTLPIAKHSPRLVALYGYAQGPCPAHDEAPSLEADDLGWTWIAQVRPALYAWNRLDLRPTRRPPRWLPGDLSTLTRLGPTRGANVTWRSAQRSTGPGYLLAGDAAAVLDPATGHGVLRALMTGIAAATAVVRDAPDGYSSWLHDWVEADVREMRARYRRFTSLANAAPSSFADD